MVFGIAVISENCLYFIFGALSSFYFVPIALKCVLFLADIIKGVKEKEAVFLGVLNETRLDVFYRVKYTNIYFDDEILMKNYMVFSDVRHEDIKRGDILKVSYYPLSRIVIKIDGPPQCREQLLQPDGEGT